MFCTRRDRRGDGKGWNIPDHVGQEKDGTPGGGRARGRRACRNFMAHPQAGQQTAGLSGSISTASPARSRLRIRTDIPRRPDPGRSHPAPWQSWTMPGIQTGRRRSHALRQQGCRRKAAAGLHAVQRGGPPEPIIQLPYLPRHPTPWRKSPPRVRRIWKFCWHLCGNPRTMQKIQHPFPPPIQGFRIPPNIPAGDKAEHSPAILSVNQ